MSGSIGRTAPHHVSMWCSLLILVNLWDVASAAEIWVITDREHPIQSPPGTRLIELDAAARIKAELSSELPSDPKQASLIVQQRLKRIELQERFANAYQGVIDAWGLGVAKIPAIVVDHRYVIYGETDVVRALAQIQKYIERERTNER